MCEIVCVAQDGSTLLSVLLDKMQLFANLNHFSYIRMNEKGTQVYIRGYFYILIFKEFLIGNE